MTTSGSRWPLSREAVYSKRPSTHRLHQRKFCARKSSVCFLYYFLYSVYICLRVAVNVCRYSGGRIRERLHLHPGPFAEHHGRLLEDGVGAKRQDNHHGDSSEAQGHSEKDTLCVWLCLCWCVVLHAIHLWLLWSRIFPDFEGSDEMIDARLCALKYEATARTRLALLSQMTANRGNSMRTTHKSSSCLSRCSKTVHVHV